MRLLPAALIGGLFGALLALLEGTAVLFTHQLSFSDPMGELFALELRYALVLALIGAVVPLVLRRRTLPFHSALTAFLGLSILGGWWVHKEVLDASRIWEPISLAASVGVVLGAAILALGVLLLARGVPRVSLFVLLAAVLVGPKIVSDRGTDRGAGYGEHATKDGHPDVTLIVIDTLRRDRLSCYGHDVPTTPVLDSIAARGALFRHCTAQAPWTRPSMASLHSGLYPSSHGCNDLSDVLPSAATTLAERFRAAGYATGAFSANANISPTFGFDQGFDRFWNTRLQDLARFTMYGRLRHTFLKYVMKVNPYAAKDDADTVTDQALRWVGGGREAPVFTYVHYLDPHWPYEPKEFLLDGDPPPVFEYDPLLQAPPRFPFGVKPGMPPEAIASALRYYDAEIRFCDRSIGRLLDGLRAAGQLGPEDLLVVTSDHGEQFYEHGSWGHGTSMFQEELHVPLIVAGGAVPAGVVYDQTVRVFDVYPTLLELAGLEAPVGLSAQSLVPIFTGAETESLRPAFSERISGSWEGRLISEGQGAFNWKTQTSVQVGQRKLIEMQDLEHLGEPFYLSFDLAQNPGEKLRITPPGPHETLDRSDPAFHAEPDLLEILEATRERAREAGVEGTESGGLSPEMAEQLRNMGYVEDRPKDRPPR